MGKGPQFRYVAGEALKDVYKRKTGPVSSVPTPIETWNNLCAEEGGREGIAHGWVVVVGGMPGSRKSYLGLNLAAHAVELGKLVGAINFEMSFDGYATRYLSVLSGVAKDDIGWGREFVKSEWEQAREKANAILEENGGALITNEATAFTLGHIHDAYEAFGKEGVELVIVDYVQLVRAGHGDLKERAGAIAESLRELSHKHKVATLALSQINRAGMNEDKPPRMSDLYGGMYWEANANQVVMLDHTYMQDSESERCTRTNLIVDKNRHERSLVEIPVKWNWDTMRIEEDIAYQQGVNDIVETAPPGYFNDDDEDKGDSQDDDDIENLGWW